MNDILKMSVTSIQIITIYITNITSYVLLVLRNIGCLCNFLTFTSKSLRRNSCGWYLLMSALFDFCYINFGLLTKIVSDQHGSKLQNTNLAWCKIRTYFTWILPCFATSFLVLASLDRCLSTFTNATLRSFSQLKVAYRMTCVPLILYSLTTSHQFFYYVLQPDCVPLPGIYSFFLSMYSIIWTNLIPQSAIIVFGLITYYNIHKIRQRLSHPTTLQRSRADSHLIIITLVQVLCSSILLNIRTIYYSYTVLSKSLIKDEYRQAVENMLLQISSLLFYLNFSKNFFINTLSSKLFRRVFHKRMAIISRQIFCRKLRIHPTQEQ